MSVEECECPPPFVSTFWRTKYCTIPINILEFQYSFGCNVKKIFNLVAIQEDVLVFASGNILHFFNVTKGELSFRRSANGGGIGYITKNPNPKYNYLTVAENGRTPEVIIYEYPQMNVISVLEKAAIRCFTCVSYSNDGELVATQAGEPDYLLTIWKWQNSSVVLRVPSFQNDVLNVVFSPYNPTQLTTCGLGHIKFWKMAKTFTGLKLQGDLGRFGKTEFSDIYAICPLPDEKVISGCEWGNMLLWDAGLIKLEVCRKARKPCHKGPIMHIHMDEGELFTVGMDGFVRIWFWETVELADPPEDDRFVEIEPIYEFAIGLSQFSTAEVRHIVRIKPSEPLFYVQDGFGAIWIVDLDVDKNFKPSKRIFQCHGGGILTCDSSSFSPHLASMGASGKLYIYNYIKNELMFVKQFNTPANYLIWLPTTIDSSGCVLIIGFEDGVIRQIDVDLENKDLSKSSFHLINVFKPHTMAITKLSINPEASILVSGSKDETIFVHQLKKVEGSYVKIIPIGFLNLSLVPVAFNWKPESSATIIIGCFTGEVLKCNLPETPRNYTKISYKLQDIKIQTFKFNSVKSKIRRDLYLREMELKKAMKRSQKIDAMKKLKEENPGIVVDEETFLADSEPEEELEPLYIPKPPNPILWLRYTKENTIWLSLAGYDAGYIYECTFSDDSAIRSTLIPGGDDIEIHSYYECGDYLIFGMKDGQVRVNKVKDNFRNLSDYWMLSMHDNLNGVIPMMNFSYDGSYFFTVGSDGNVFSYKWNGPIVKRVTLKSIRPSWIPKAVVDIEDRSYLSLEEEKQKRENDRRQKLAFDRKQKVLDVLGDYKVQFKEIIKRNVKMPILQQLSSKELELDERITYDMVKSLEDEIDVLRKKTAYDVEKSTVHRQKLMNHFIQPLEGLPFAVSGIRINTTIKSFRIKNLDDQFYEMKKQVQIMMNLAEEHNFDLDLKLYSQEESSDEMTEPYFDDSFLMNISVDRLIFSINPKIRKMLTRFRSRRLGNFYRNYEIKKLHGSKPDPTKNDPDDDRAIREAEKTIGDYKLKTDPNYIPPVEENAKSKYLELLQMREELFHLRNEYNQKVLKLREQKKLLYEFVEQKKAQLLLVHKSIPKKVRKEIPPLPGIDYETEYPEKNLVPSVEVNKLTDIEALLHPKLENLLESNRKIAQRCGFFTNELITSALDLEGLSVYPDFDNICDQVKNLLISLEEHPPLFKVTEVDLLPWEIELRYKIINNNIIEQDKILREIEERIEFFDKELLQLMALGKQIDMDAIFMEERVMTLNQELLIINDCERLDHAIVQDVDEAIRSKMNVTSSINHLTNTIESNKKYCEKVQEQIKSIQVNFMKEIKGNNFFDFLRRIFKKKYKPPKMENAEDSTSSSESDSSTSEDLDQGSADSFELTAIRFDENVLPPGCDKKLYDLAFSSRTDRHALEQQLYQMRKTIENQEKDVDAFKKEMELSSLHVEAKKEILVQFRRERQQLLNKINVLVVLRMDQLQHIKEGEDFRNIDDTLVFNGRDVTKLYTRVGQLRVETLETQRRHKINVVHLQRLKTDVKYMLKKIHNFEQEIQDSSLKKFGIIISVDEVEETTLRKYMFNQRLSLTEEKREFQAMMEKKKKHLDDVENELVKETQIGTEKLNILTVLYEENNYLAELLRTQKRSYQKIESTDFVDLREDLTHLKDICFRQEEQIEFLEKEIRSLRLRSRPLDIPPTKVEEGLGYMEVLPPADESTYEETIASRIPRVVTPSKNVYPDSCSAQRIKQIVQKFLVKTVGKQMPEEVIRKYTTKISDYIGFVANNSDCDQAEKVMECVMENFQAMVPNKYLLYIKPEDIKNLFQEVIQVFDSEKFQASLPDVINGIVSSALEVCHSRNVPQFGFEVMKEIFQNLIELLSSDDFQNPQCAELIYKVLKPSVYELDPRCIHVSGVIQFLAKHARENLLDEYNQRVVKETLENVIDRLIKYYRKYRAEKPLEPNTLSGSSGLN